MRNLFFIYFYSLGQDHQLTYFNMLVLEEMIKNINIQNIFNFIKSFKVYST
jgi:hypothetical protein